MPQQKSELVDHLPVLSSAKSGWENIRVEQYCLPTGESPERELQRLALKRNYEQKNY
jgi:hypothetical protein